jgi:hypothetical protein
VEGNSYYSNAYANCCAESIVLVLAADQIGDEYVSGDNQITYAACGGPQLTDSFGLFYTKATLLVSNCVPNSISGVTELTGTWGKSFGGGARRATDIL